MSTSRTTERRPQRTTSVVGAHDDDIHGVLQLGPRHVATGSKDGYVKLWNLRASTRPDGTWPAKIESQRVLHYPRHPKSNNIPWITALCAVGDASDGGGPRWASATRHGAVTLWGGPTHAPRRTRTFNLARHSRRTRGHVCKARNRNRVMCAASPSANAALDGGSDPGAPMPASSALFVGLAAQVAIVSLDAPESSDDGAAPAVHFRRASANDWLYTMRFVDGTPHMLAAIGPTICTIDTTRLVAERDTDDSPDGVHPSVETLLSESAHREVALESASSYHSGSPRSRLFVSALDQGATSPGLCLAACFDGTVKTLDIERGVVCGTADHYRTYARDALPSTTRIWGCSVLDADGCVFASCADDGRVLVWDSRSAGNAPVRRIPPRSGRVSVAMPLRRGGPDALPCTLSDPLLVSFCADNPSAGGGGHLETWDLRMTRSAEGDGNDGADGGAVSR